MYIWGKSRAAGRVRLFVGNRGSGRVTVSTGRVGSKKSDPWTTLGRQHCMAETRKTSRQAAEAGSQDGVVLEFFLNVTLPRKIIN